MDQPTKAMSPLLAWNQARPDGPLTHSEIAAGIGCTPPNATRVLNGGRTSWQLAIRIHVFTHGAVPGNVLRPDLWRRAEDVPVPETQTPERHP